MQIAMLLLAIIAAYRAQQGGPQVSYIPADEPVFDLLMEA